MSSSQVESPKESRKTRQQKTRNSPNSKLLNAAWPKPPTVPTRRSQIKAVNHGGFEKSWGQWRHQSPVVVDNCIEDMEVDVDMDDMARTSRKSGLSPVPTPKASPTGNRTTMKGATRKVVPVASDDHRVTLKAKRLQNEQSTSAIDDNPSQRRSTRGSMKVEKEELPSEPANKNKNITEKMKIDRNKENTALFIIIHVSQVELASMKGAATSPVKVYAEKFMVQMEDEATKKEVSFRVPCKKITSLDISLTKKPFMIKFTTSELQYITGGPPKSRKSRGGQELETILLHLGYEESVPEDVQIDLKELFQVRLAELHLWPEKDDRTSPVNESIELDEKNKLSDKNDNVEADDKVEKNEEKKTVKRSTQVDDTTTTTATTTTATATATATEVTKSPSKGAKIISVRKRTPNRSKSDSEPVKTNDLITKYPRRCNFEATESLEEQVKTFSHEAAHYQAAFAQQRMIIQSMENDMERRSTEYERQIEELQIDLDETNRTLLSRDIEIPNFHKDLKVERDLVKAFEDRIDSMRRELSEKDRTIGEKNNAVRVRNDTIQQLRVMVRQYQQNDKSLNGETPQEETVPLSTMEETRQNLMQMQVSKENLSVELEQTRMNLLQKTTDLDNLSSQLGGVQTELRTKDERLLQLRSDFITSQEELVRKNERIRLLNEQLTESGDNNAELGVLRSELLNTKSELDDVRIELTETKLRLEDRDNETQTRPSNDWTIERGEIAFQDGIVGVGAWGNVKKGKFRGSDVAVKQIHLLILSPHNRRLFEREMSIASRCRHPCLVQFIGATNDDGTPLFVMELLETDLRSLLSREALNNKDCVQIGFDVICALAYLHQSKPMPIIHRDISSSNILLYQGNNRWRAKLSDYGAANFMRLAMTRHPGAFLYSAPEASTVDQTTKLDVYSFGVLFCEMCTRELPVPENRREQVDAVTNIEHKMLIKNCLKRDINKRLDSSSVLQVFDGWLTTMETTMTTLTTTTTTTT